MNGHRPKFHLVQTQLSALIPMQLLILNIYESETETVKAKVVVWV